MLRRINAKFEICHDCVLIKENAVSQARQEQLTPGVSPLYFGSDGVLSTSDKLRPFLPQGSASATWAATEEKFENLPKGM
jgi:hypothetical protein